MSERNGFQHGVPCWVDTWQDAIPADFYTGLFGWGADYFGWHDPTGRVQLALFTSFILGVIASYKSRG